MLVLAYPSESPSLISSSMSNGSDTLNILPVTHTTMPISTLNEIPNDIQHAYNMQEFLIKLGELKIQRFIHIKDNLIFN